MNLKILQTPTKQYQAELTLETMIIGGPRGDDVPGAVLALANMLEEWSEELPALASVHRTWRSAAAALKEKVSETTDSPLVS